MPGNERGTGPATFGSPVYLAAHTSELHRGTDAPVRARLRDLATDHMAEDRLSLSATPYVDEDAGAEATIEEEFGRKLIGLRRLPKRERAQALRSARETRCLALKALSEKRATARRAWVRLQRQRRLVPV